MPGKKYTITAFILVLAFLVTQPLAAQLGTSLTIKKPKEYEDRTLASEKSDQKKFTLPKRFFQNAFTHYNYFFNANQKLNEIITRAKTAFQEDYSTLLPFYNYTLETTAQDSLELDSLLDKSQTGIALHDLRNDWIDNLYLLWGAAYYLKQQHDSAYLMFQYINYAFAPKEKDGYYITIGSRADGNSAYSIATKEKRSLPKRIFSEPPSRNDAFIWQIRNFLAQDEFAEAASLIVTLRNDPVFPSRLQNDLEEVQAYWFYKQNMWDSAANHLSQALSNATNRQERARWEYLLAQLYERSGKFTDAEKAYAKAIAHTTDPVMDVYARLSSIRVHKDGTDNYIDHNIAALLKMARKTRYEEYRDIIYYTAAQMELERNNVDAAIPLLVKSTQVPGNNVSQRNKAFLQLAQLQFARKKYRPSYNYYDSIRENDPKLTALEEVKQRKTALRKVVQNMDILDRQDSLLRIAALPEDERRDLVKKLVKKLRKEQGLKDEESNDGTFTTGSTGAPGAASPVFGSPQTRGEWYFYNQSAKQRGAIDFKSRWGSRPNVDNWRRSNAIAAQIAMNDQKNGVSGAPVKNVPLQEADLSFDGLYSKLPLTPEAVQKTNDSIQQALFNLGVAYIQQIEDCEFGTSTLEQLRSRFPGFKPMDEVLFNLYYCYDKNGDLAKAADIRKAMTSGFAKSRYTTIVTTGKDPADTKNDSAATQAYERIYDLFLEGSFDTAVAEKKKADSLYSHNYWTPQLLYIESVYYIHQRQDSTAKVVLNNIVQKFGGTAMAERAKTLIDVLGRRAQIEDELTRLQINVPEADTARRYHPRTAPVVAQQPVQRTDSVAANPPVVQTPVRTIPQATDSTQNRVITPTVSPFVYDTAAAHYVVVMLTNITPIFANEVKMAYDRYDRAHFYNTTFTLDLKDIDATTKFLLISPFNNQREALDYIDAVKPATTTQILPWLKNGRYNYAIINQKNLDILQSANNLEDYKAFLNQHFPNRF